MSEGGFEPRNTQNTRKEVWFYAVSRWRVGHGRVARPRVTAEYLCGGVK